MCDLLRCSNRRLELTGGDQNRFDPFAYHVSKGAISQTRPVWDRHRTAAYIDPPTPWSVWVLD